MDPICPLGIATWEFGGRRWPGRPLGFRMDGTSGRRQCNEATFQRGYFGRHDGIAWVPLVPWVACSRDDLQGRPCSWMDRSALLGAMKTRPSTTFATDAFSSLPPFNIASQDALRMAPHRPTYSRGRKSGHRGRQRTHLAAWEQEPWAIDSIPA